MTPNIQILKREVNDLVLEQIFVFKEPTDLTDRQLLEYHLRHLRIMTSLPRTGSRGMGAYERQSLSSPVIL
jgi:hypothetical protein